MVLASKLDEGGKVAWIAATILAFWLWWPLGLAMLAYLAGSGRFRAWKCAGGPGRWHNADGGSGPGGGWAAPNWGSGWGCGWGGRSRQAPGSGNRAFDEYRAETLRRLEEEQREFVEYLERLRQAKDKSEFDAFMEDRRRQSQTPPAERPDAA